MTNTILRFDPEISGPFDSPDIEMKLQQDGTWVSYEDYANEVERLNQVIYMVRASLERANDALYSRIVKP